MLRPPPVALRSTSRVWNTFTVTSGTQAWRSAPRVLSAWRTWASWAASNGCEAKAASCQRFRGTTVLNHFGFAGQGEIGGQVAAQKLPQDLPVSGQGGFGLVIFPFQGKKLHPGLDQLNGPAFSQADPFFGDIQKFFGRLQVFGGNLHQVLIGQHPVIRIPGTGPVR